MSSEKLRGVELKAELKRIASLESGAWAERGLRRETLERFGVKVEWGSSLGDMGNPEKVYFPYRDPKTEKITGYKIKDLNYEKDEAGHWTVVGKAGVKSMLFGEAEARKSAKKLFISEGECFNDETQVLTDTGWKVIKDLSANDLVMQVDGTLVGSFVKPIAYIEKEYNGDMISLSTKGFSSVTTPEHNMVVLDYKNRLIKAKANDLKTHYKIPTTVTVNGPGCGLSFDQIALQIAVSADSKIDKRKTMNYYVHFEFKKDRKKERLKGILERLEIPFTSFEQLKEGYTSFNFTMPDYMVDKDLPISWLNTMTLEERRFVISEQVHWDGNHVPNREQIEFSSATYSQAEWMHTMAHTAGYSGSIIVRKSSPGHYGTFDWYKVSILFKKKYVFPQVSLKREVETYCGKVYCVTVPEGRLLVKHKDHIHVSGNCDTMALYQVMVDKTKGSQYEKYTPAVVSISAGCPNSVASVMNREEFVNSYKEVVLAFDNDCRGPLDKTNVMRGKEAVDAVGCNLTKVDVYVLNVPEPYNDLNDMLIDNNGATLAELAMFNTVKFKGDKVLGASDIDFEELIKPKKKGLMINAFPKLMEKIGGIRKNELTILTAATNVGKTVIVSEIAFNLGMTGDEKVALIFLEENKEETLMRMIARKLEVNYYEFVFDPLKFATREELMDAYNWCDEKFFLIDIFGGLKTEDLMNKIRNLVFVVGCSYIVLDHITMVLSTLDQKVDERRAIDALISELATFVAKTPVGIFAVSHLNSRAFAEVGKIADIKDTKWICTKKEDLRGSASIAQLAWTIIGVDYELKKSRERGNVRLTVLKNRTFGKLGECDVFTLNKKGLIQLVEEEKTGY